MNSARLLNIMRCAIAGGAVCVAFSLPSYAQVKSTTTEARGDAVHQVKVERGEIVYINGNNVIVKMEDGTYRHFDNVPDTVTFMVDGQPVTIKNAKVGMKLEKQTVTSTTPKVVTKVETVTGKVFHVTPPLSVILTLENGENQQFKIPKGQKFMVDGQETDAFGLKKGMMVSAQRVTEVPETEIAQEIKRTGSAPPPPPAPKPDIPVLVATAPPAPAPVQTAAAEPAPTKLPKTASDLPLVGLIGALFCSLSLMVLAMRKLVSRPSHG